MSTDIIYSRVSKEDETLQDIKIQEKKLIEKFNLKNPIIYRDRGSAYDMKKFKKRKKFIKFIRSAFNSHETTLDDIFLGNYEKKQINLYIWDSHRVMRNMQFSLFFLLLSDFFGVEVYTYKDGNLKGEDEETPSKKLLRYMIMAIHSYSGEEYSYTTSENIKKSFEKKGKSSYSIERITKDGKVEGGLKVGKNFTKTDGTKINLPYEDLKALNNKIIKLHRYYRFNGIKVYYNNIINKIKKDYSIVISKSYISGLRNESNARKKNN